MGKGFDLAKAMGYEVSKLDTVQELPLDKLDPNPDNFFPVESDLTELAESISVNGLLQPLVVTPADGGRYRVVAGHRRRMALLELAKADPAKWRMIPCKIIHPATHDMELLALIQTNTVARELGWHDRSEAATRVEAILVRLQQEQGVTLPGKMRERVAKIVKASESQIARAKYIAKHLVEELRGPELKDDAAYKLAHLPPEQQHELAEHYHGRYYQLTTSAIKQYVDNVAAGRKPFQTPKYVPTCYSRGGKGGKYPQCDCYDAILARRKRELPPEERCPGNQCCCNCYRKYDCADCCQRLAAGIAKWKQTEAYAIGQRLRRAREAAGFSRADLRAHGSKLFVHDVYHYEAGRYQFSVEKLMDFCNLYHADPDVILGYSTPGWQNCKGDTAELPDGALCLVLIRDPVTPAFVTARVARWKGNVFVSAVNETSRISGDFAGFVRLHEPPDGCSFSVEVVPNK